MKTLPHLFSNNKAWADKIRASIPGFFEQLTSQQAPRYLWIGCSDSRVPANEIVGLLPGELFVHRNVANLALHTDMNCMSVLQYAVEILGIHHVIVCGHYGCGGIKAALERKPHGLVDNWLRPIRDIRQKHLAELNRLPDEDAQRHRLCELNVIEQVVNVGNTTILQNAWDRGEEIILHGWIYDLADGLLKDLDVSVRSAPQLESLKNKLSGMDSPGNP
ncbi:MAG: carbonate dehydratase [Verrucomicrobia bacterium]|nr:carbonate dehydratase [Kiritimatiellia bacterium]MCP5488939.1 carbonate dehydratase [Verrucomicrobiota bacterium]